MANQPDVRIRLTAEGVKEVVQALQQVQAQARQSAQKANDVGGGFAGATKGVEALKGAVGSLAMAAAGLVALDKIKDWAAHGLELNASMEKAQVSLAGVLASQAKLVDGSGRVLKGQEAYAAAVQLSGDYMAGLQEKAAAAGVDFDSLAQQSSMLVFTGINAGVKDMNKLQELTVLSAAMMRTFGEDTEATGEQLKNLLRGEGSDITDALGIDDDALKRWKQQGTLLDEVIKRLNSGDAAAKAYASTWDGIKLKMAGALKQFNKEAFSGLFDNLKAGMASALDGVLDKTGKMRPEVEAVANLFNRIGSSVGGVLADGVAAVVNGLRSSGTWLQQNSKLVNGLGNSFSEVAGFVGKLVNGLVVANEYLSLMTRVGGAIAAIFGGIATAVNLAQQGIAKLMEATTTDETKKAYYANEAALARKRAEINLRDANAGMKQFATGEASGAADAAGSQGGKAGGKASARFVGAANKHIATADEIAAAKAKQEAISQMRIAEADRAAKLEMVIAKTAAAINKESYDQGKKALKAYNEDRLAEINNEAKQELDVLQAQLDRANSMKTASAEDKRAKELAIYQAETAIKAREAQRDADIEAQKRQYQIEQEALDEQLAKVQADIAEKYGERGAAALAALKAELKATEDLLTKQGLAADKIEEYIGKLRAAGMAGIEFDKASTGADAVNSKYDLQKKGVEIDQAGGRLWGFEASQKLADIEKKRLADLEAAAKKMAEIANGPGGTDEMKQKAEDLNLAVKQLRDSTDEYGQAMARVKQTLETSLQSGFNNMLDSLLEGTATAKEAFRAFAYDVVSNIRKIAQEFLVQQAMKSFFSSFSGGGAGAGAGIMSMFGFANGGLVKAATGGYIRGPGSATSDSIPARLSNGEYVIRADAVKGVGVDVLDLINQTGSLSPLLANSYAARSIPAVDGGVASSIQQAAGGGTSRVELGLEPGIVAKHIKSTEGQKAVIEVMASRRRSVKKATG